MFPFKQTFKAVNSGNGAGKDMPQHGISWPLNPAAYQNVCNDEVDWAALAQQWIYMKETCPYEGMPEAPPPPNISNSISRQEYEEKGEAPMEVEKDDEQINENAVFAETSSAGDIISGTDMLSESQNSPNWGTTGWNSHGWRKSEIFRVKLYILYGNFSDKKIFFLERTRLEHMDKSKYGTIIFTNYDQSNTAATIASRSQYV